MVTLHISPDVKLEQLFREHQGFLKRGQAIKAGIDPHRLSRWVEEGRAERVQRGIYRLTDAEPLPHETLLEVSLRVPSGVVCLRSALAFHRLGSVSPPVIDLAIPHKGRAPAIDYPPVKLYYFSETVYRYGIEAHEVGPGQVKVYTAEKTLADLLYYRHKLGNDLFIEGLQAYLRRPYPKVSMLMEAARVRRVQKLMHTYLEPLL
ncbi:type IV toxin-antitoxin system AbiEi family antitoxin domain-containing protein [uncultured Meiothermus sp.]|jgi:predicted transcriptional regulator of viral defense system|uniref:type IV toxin-antitoxin system AbiEi family antitoxin domain-containing protein n=1 Tax=uncultured Meiothermus sp. TaxID=157471 RepID=UPI00262B231C|nr:type IV toxin-antitoxin system AbiEi family antitoxin domain-containing protein [uncultured Meiothermus sp.]